MPRICLCSSNIGTYWTLFDTLECLSVIDAMRRSSGSRSNWGSAREHPRVTFDVPVPATSKKKRKSSLKTPATADTDDVPVPATFNKKRSRSNSSSSRSFPVTAKTTRMGGNPNEVRRLCCFYCDKCPEIFRCMSILKDHEPSCRQNYRDELTRMTREDQKAMMMRMSEPRKPATPTRPAPAVIRIPTTPQRRPAPSTPTPQRPASLVIRIPTTPQRRPAPTPPSTPENQFPAPATPQQRIPTTPQRRPVPTPSTPEHQFPAPSTPQQRTAIPAPATRPKQKMQPKQTSTPAVHVPAPATPQQRTVSSPSPAIRLRSREDRRVLPRPDLPFSDRSRRARESREVVQRAREVLCGDGAQVEWP